MHTLVDALNVCECSKLTECGLNVAHMNATLCKRMWMSQNALKLECVLFRMH